MTSSPIQKSFASLCLALGDLLPLDRYTDLRGALEKQIEEIACARWRNERLTEPDLRKVIPTGSLRLLELLPNCGQGRHQLMNRDAAPVFRFGPDYVLACIERGVDADDMLRELFRVSLIDPATWAPVLKACESLDGLMPALLRMVLGRAPKGSGEIWAQMLRAQVSRSPEVARNTMAAHLRGDIPEIALTLLVAGAPQITPEEIDAVPERQLGHVAMMAMQTAHQQVRLRHRFRDLARFAEDEDHLSAWRQELIAESRKSEAA